MANDLTFKQLATVLNSIVSQATGKNTITPTNTSEFVAVGNTALQAGYDPIMNAVSQTLSKTIFSVRPYYEKFSGLRVDAIRWGNHVRKLNAVDKDFVADDRYTLTDGQSVDQYIVRKPEVLQTNFYGGDTFSDYITVFRDQIDNAFTGPDQFGSFLSMIMGNISDRHAQARENLARACLANFIGGKVSGDTGSIVHLLTEYNTQTGLSLTAQTVYQPANFAPFMQWAYSRVAEVSAMLTERSQKYHINVTDKEVNRHTPYERQKVFMFASARFQMDSRVLADTYHDNYLRYAANETVNFWQSIDTPDQIQIQPSYLLPSGAIQAATDPVTVDNIFAAIIDEEAAGYTIIHEWMAPTPFNARGGYTNMWWHFDRRYWNDFTENGVIFLLD